MWHWNNYSKGCIFILVSFLFACNTATNEPTDTPTSGEVNIVVDESFQQLFDTEIYTFHSLYQNAKVNALFLPETDALQRLNIFNSAPN